VVFLFETVIIRIFHNHTNDNPIAHENIKKTITTRARCQPKHQCIRSQLNAQRNPSRKLDDDIDLNNCHKSEMVMIPDLILNSTAAQPVFPVCTTREKTAKRKLCRRSAA
jgi:hypothetical protein